MYRNKWKKHTTTQNLWDSVKTVLRGRFIAIHAYVKKQKKNQIYNLTWHLKQLEKEVHWDDPEEWYGEGGGRRVQDGEHMYTCGRFI